MNTKTMALAAAAVACFAGAAQAQDFQPKAAGHVILNVRVTDVAPDANNKITTLAGAATGLKAKVSDDVMPTIGLTYFFTDNVAVEVIAGTTKHTIRAKGGATDVKVQETWVLPPVVSLQYHFANRSKITPFLGLGVNYTRFFDTDGKGALQGAKLDLGDSWGIAAHAGLDFALPGKGALRVDLRWADIDTQVKVDGARLGTARIDPLVYGASYVFRF